ncbi:MAG: hypothetical protein IPL61_06695 [Myxococcales bacterium]|nr:hypothetical protein [Myxococcales bacterium]
MHAQGRFQGPRRRLHRGQIAALVIGAIAPGSQYADVIRILKLATDPLGGLLEVATTAKAARAAKAATTVEHAVDGAVVGERAGLHAAEGAAAGERRLGSVFEEATAGGKAGAGADGAHAGAGLRAGESVAAHEAGPANLMMVEDAARPLSRLETLRDALPPDLHGRVRIVESPVHTDSTVSVTYRDGVEIVVGAQATPRHIAYHIETARALLRYEGLTGEIRKLIDQVLSLLHIRAGYGTRGFEADLEVRKLTGIRDDLHRLLARTDGRLHGGAALDPAELRAELASVEAQLAEHRQALGSFEDGRGAVAAEGPKATPQTGPSDAGAPHEAKTADGRGGPDPEAATTAGAAPVTGPSLTTELGQLGARLHAAGVAEAEATRLTRALQVPAVDPARIAGYPPHGLPRIANPKVLDHLEEVAALQRQGRITGLDDWIETTKSGATAPADLALELREAVRQARVKPDDVIHIGSDAKAPMMPGGRGRARSFDMAVASRSGAVSASVEVTAAAPVRYGAELGEAIRHGTVKAVDRAAMGMPIEGTRELSIYTSLAPPRDRKSGLQAIDKITGARTKTTHQVPPLVIPEGNLYEEIAMQLDRTNGAEQLDGVTLLDRNSGSVLAAYHRDGAKWELVR